MPASVLNRSFEFAVFRRLDKKQNNGLIGHNCGVPVITVTVILIDSMGDCFYNKNLFRSSINFIFNVKTDNSHYYS